jgi:hypothetical protein
LFNNLIAVKKDIAGNLVEMIKIHLKIVLISWVLSIASTTSHAQTVTVNGISFFIPGYFHERPVTDQITTRILLGVLPQFQSSVEVQDGLNAYLSGVALLSVRNYYNMMRRVERGRKTDRNSANYLTASVQLISSPVGFYDDACNCVDFPGDPVYRGEREKDEAMRGMIFGVNWGLQRFLFDRVTIDLNIGPAYSTFFKSPLLQSNISLVVWLGAREKNEWYSFRTQ